MNLDGYGDPGDWLNSTGLLKNGVSYSLPRGSEFFAAEELSGNKTLSSYLLLCIIYPNGQKSDSRSSKCYSVWRVPSRLGVFPCLAQSNRNGYTFHAAWKREGL